MSNSIRFKKLILAVAAVLCCGICIFSISGNASAATYTDKSGKWTCTIVDETAKTVSIKPAKTGVAGVSKGAITIPNTVVVNSKTYKVTMIAGSAYANNKTITSVKTVSGSSLVQINVNAFQNCTALTNVDFSMSNSLTKIYGTAFANCTAVTKFNFKNSNLTGVAANAFSKAGKSTTNIWVKNSGSYNKVKASGTLVSSPVAYNYTITYNGNGKTGGTVPAAASAVYTTNITLSSNALTRTGYTFGGWNTKADGTGTNYKAGQSVKGITKTGVITLYAKWTPIQYNIRFQHRYSTEKGAMSDMTLTYDKAAKLDPCKFTRDGYIFKGWAVNGNPDKVVYADQASVKNLTTKTEIICLFPVWTPITYTVTFVERDDKTPEVVNATYDQSLPKNIPGRTGYTFMGWSRKADRSTVDYAPRANMINLTTTNKANVTLYAVWEKKSYTFTFYPYKEYGTNDDPGYTVSGVQPDKKCYYDTAAKLDKCVYKRAGYTFAGWYTELPSKQVLPDGADVTNFIDTSDTIPLYALWEPINYTITFSLENSDDDVIGTAPESIACTYDAEYTIDLSTLKPTVSFPHLPENTRTIDEVGDVKIDQVVIGSCTNGRMDDLRIAASVLKGKKVKKGLRVIVIPATQKIYLQAMEEGLLRTFIEAGAVVSTPTCGPCLGGYMGILAAGERCVSTTNRNFVGRMGHVDSEVYLASPAVAAASAVTGKISSPEEVM